MSLGGPNIYPGVLSWLGLARELTAGTPLVPSSSNAFSITHPLEQGSFEPEDTPKFLKDNAIRGAMTDLFYETLGVESATFSFGGPNFLDSHGYFFDNVFGDLSSTASAIGGSPQTISGTAQVGATSFTVGATTGFTVGAYIQLGTAAVSNTPGSYANEIIQVSGTTATVVTFANTPLRFAHPTSINGTVITGSTLASTLPSSATQFTHRFAALNSQLGYGGAFGAQPPTHTFTDVTNIVNVFTSASFGNAPSNPFGARVYPSAVLKSIDFSGNAEQLLSLKMAGDTWLSQAAGTSPTNLTTNSRPIPNWAATVTIGGNTVSSTGSYAGIGEFSVSFKRTTQVYWIVAGTQTPYVIARGPLNMDGTISWDPTNSETPLDLMLLNAQAPMNISLTNANIPNAGTPFTLTFQASQVANIKAKINRSKALIGYANTFEGIANNADFGGSGGLGPGTITLVNNIPTY